MKKTIGLFIVLATILLGLCFIENKKNEVVLVDGERTPFSIRLHYDMGELMVHPWYDETAGIWYVFLPGYVDLEEADCSQLKQGDFYVDGEKQNRRFTWQDNMQYEISYCGQTMQVVFLKEENLSNLFIETQSGTNDVIRAAKENVEKGHIVSLDHRGNVQYDGKMKEISGHGNAWQFYDKRAYDIKLNGKATLAGIDGGNQWKLLHLWNDGDKIHSKLAFDIAQILGADYTPDATWVNVYLNGEYHGMYLLTTAVRDKDVFNTKDVLFLEKDLEDRYTLEEHVVSEEGNGFVIHRPKEVTEEEKEKIGQLVQEVENSIADGNLQQELIDVDSFATQFLVDEITLNSDGFETSTYLYRTAEGKPFCAGPAWDYDGAFGEYLHTSENHVNPGQSVLDGEPTELTWYQKLYDNPEFLDTVIGKYEAAMPQLRKLYEENIDLYARYIATSVRNDDIRWGGYNETLPRTGNYQTWENDVRYLKYFCTARYNALMERWRIEGDKIAFETTGEDHKVKVLYGGKETVIEVRDGETLKPQQLDEICTREGCVTKIAYSEEPYSEYMPVLEDFAIKVEARPTVDETEEYKYVHIPKDIFAENYDYVSVFMIDSGGNMENLQVAEPLSDIYLELDKEQTGTIAIYVFGDATGTTVLEEVVIEY